MRALFWLVLIEFMLIVVFPDPARSAGSSVSDTNRNEGGELANSPNKDSIIMRTYMLQPMAAAIFTDDASGTNLPPAVQSENIKKFFVESGVIFPDGASLIYKPKFNLLIISSTADHLARIERILSVLNKSPVCVEVEVRFIEIRQNDLDDLGAQWLNGVESSTVSKQGKMDQTGSHASPVQVSPGPTVSDLLASTSVLTDPELSSILHALEQGAGANMISAPKVITESGKNAEIKVVREVPYPMAFEEEMAVLDKASGTISLLSSNQPATASNKVITVFGIPIFEIRDTGVILNVTPTVDQNGTTIHLNLYPKVVELVEWIDYGSTMTYADGSTQQVKMLQPIFHSRELATQLSLQDGQTIVMGGLVTENADKDNSEPSWFSRNFGSKPKRIIQKIHTLIFVTARIVDAAGHPIGSPKGE